MSTIEMPPDDVSGKAHHGDRDLITHDIIETCQRRAGERITYMLAAVSQFQDRSVAHIDDHLKGYTEDVPYLFGPVVDGFISGVATVLFPEGEFGKIAFEAASKMLAEGLKEAVEGQGQGDSAKDRLHAHVAALAAEVRQREVHALDTAKQHVPEAVKAGLAQIPEVSSNPDWIEQTCVWLGFPEPDHTIADPVRQWLEYEFVGLLARVQAEVEQKHGVPGLDDDDLNPDRYESEARRYERELYRKEGEQAWDDAYKMSDE